MSEVKAEQQHPRAQQMPIIVGPEFQAKWVENLPSEEYHADRTAVSSSGLRKALKSAATFRANWLSHEEEGTKVMQFGTLAHLCVLEPWKFMQTYVVQPDFGDMRSSKNRASRDEWRAEQKPGTTIVTQEEYDTLQGMVEALVAHPDARAALTNGKSELSGWYRDQETGLLCRIRPDFLHFNGKALIDIKTTVDCEAGRFSRAISSYGYHVQLAMYAAGCEAITGIRVEFPTIIAIEKKPPYEIAVYVLDQGSMDVGTALYRRALRRIAESIRTGNWAMYQKEVQSIAIPKWEFDAAGDEGLETEIGTEE